MRLQLEIIIKYGVSPNAGTLNRDSVACDSEKNTSFRQEEHLRWSVFGWCEDGTKFNAGGRNTVISSGQMLVLWNLFYTVRIVDAFKYAIPNNDTLKIGYNMSVISSYPFPDFISVILAEWLLGSTSKGCNGCIHWSWKHSKVSFAICHQSNWIGACSVQCIALP